MANTFSIPPRGKTPPGALCYLSVVKIVQATEAYATATGGFAFDFTTTWAMLGIVDEQVRHISGYTSDGFRLDFTASGSGDAWTAKAWNGSTELSDNNYSKTCYAEVFYCPSAQTNYPDPVAGDTYGAAPSS